MGRRRDLSAPQPVKSIVSKNLKNASHIQRLERAIPSEKGEGYETSVCGAAVQRPGDLVLTDGGLWGGRLLPRPRWPEGRGPPHGPGNMLTQHLEGRWL